MKKKSIKLLIGFVVEPINVNVGGGFARGLIKMNKSPTYQKFQIRVKQCQC